MHRSILRGTFAAPTTVPGGIPPIDMRRDAQMLMNEPPNRRIRHPISPRERGNVYLAPIRPDFRGVRQQQERTPQTTPLRLEPRQAFLDPLRQELSFDFRRQAKGEGQNLAHQIVIQPEAVFYRPNPDLMFQTPIQNINHHKQRATKPGDFRTDQQIPRAQPTQKTAKLSFPVVFRPRYGFLYPLNVPQIFPFGEIDNLIPLIFHSLLIRGNPNVTIDHSQLRYRAEPSPPPTITLSKPTPPHNGQKTDGDRYAPATGAGPPAAAVAVFTPVSLGAGTVLPEGTAGSGGTGRAIIRATPSKSTTTATFEPTSAITP